MKHRLFFAAVVILSGITLDSSYTNKLALAQEPAAETTPAPAAQEGAAEADTAKPEAAAPAADNTAPPAEQEPPAAEQAPAAAEQEPAAAASSGSAPAANSPSGPAKVVDSNQAAADQQRDVSRTAGMIAGVSFLIVLAYFLTRKKSKPTNG
jgi:type IV secretory pathway VirB10-like protein